MKPPSLLFRSFAWIIVGIILAVLLGLAMATHADTVAVSRVTFTANPVAGNTITVNGDVRTFRTVITNTATEISIGATPTDTALSWYNQIIPAPYTLVSPSVLGTNLSLIGQANRTLTVTASGSWFSISNAVVSLTNFSLSLPLAGVTSSLRSPQASQLVDGIATFATNAFADGLQVFSNYVARANAQTISGAKTFTGANTYSNATQLFSGGTVSNITLTAVTIPSGGGFALNTFTNSFATAIGSDANGLPTMIRYDPVALAYTYLFPSNTAGLLLNVETANANYPRLTQPNSFTAANTFTSITNSLIGSSRLTNGIAGLSSLWVTNVSVQGKAGFTNDAQALVFYQPSNATNERLYNFGGTGTNFGLNALSDDGSVSSWIWRAARIGSTGSELQIPDANVKISSQLNVTGAFYAGQGVAAGGLSVFGDASGTFGVPVGMDRGLAVANGSSPGFDPVSGVVAWSESGALKYRGSVADGGSGADRFLHNRAAEVTGSGSDFTPAGTGFARLDFGGTDVQVTLPTASTYLVSADLDFTEVTVDYDLIKAKFYNSTTTTDVANSERWLSNVKTGSHAQIILQCLVTTSSANNVLQVYVANTTAARGTFGAVLSNIRYVRLY